MLLERDCLRCRCSGLTEIAAGNVKDPKVERNGHIRTRTEDTHLATFDRRQFSIRQRLDLVNRLLLLRQVL